MKTISLPQHALSQFPVDKQPDECPHCLHKIVAVPQMGCPVGRNGNISVVFQCPNYECSKIFIGNYRKSSPHGHALESVSPPPSYSHEEFSEEIQEVCSDFSEIFNQAQQAESLKLDKISGMGYRRALEFLIKDYCVFLCPSDERDEKKNSIYKMTLINSIRAVEDSNVSRYAEKAAWLGNDESHVIKKHNNNINDLKKLIEGVIRAIDTKVYNDKTIQELNSQSV